MFFARTSQLAFPMRSWYVSPNIFPSVRGRRRGWSLLSVHDQIFLN